MTGPVLSWIVKVRVTEVPRLPQASVAVQCALITRVEPQPAVLLSSTYVALAVPLQISLALAPLFQLFRAARLPAPSHSTVLSEGAVTTGAVVSWIVKVRVAELELLPRASATVQCALTTRVAPQPGVLLSST